MLTTQKKTPYYLSYLGQYLKMIIVTPNLNGKIIKI